MTIHAIAASAVLASVTLAAVTSPAHAQRCARPDTTAEWFQRQRAWLSDVRHDWSDSALRVALLRATGLDASRPVPVQIGVQTVSDVAAPNAGDSTVLARLSTLARTRGSTWPARSVVGAAGVRAVWMLAQRDTALQRVVLHRMMESGPDEALAADVAVLEDRVRVQSGRKQLYGTQVRAVGDRLLPLPTEDSSHVDLRRDGAGLPPLATAICAAMR